MDFTKPIDDTINTNIKFECSCNIITQSPHVFPLENYDIDKYYDIEELSKFTIDAKSVDEYYKKLEVYYRDLEEYKKGKTSKTIMKPKKPLSKEELINILESSPRQSGHRYNSINRFGELQSFIKNS